ncbi:hypothetical protein LZ659_14190, partial [Shewanella indica]
MPPASAEPETIAAEHTPEFIPPFTISVSLTVNSCIFLFPSYNIEHIAKPNLCPVVAPKTPPATIPAGPKIPPAITPIVPPIMEVLNSYMDTSP